MVLFMKLTASYGWVRATVKRLLTNCIAELLYLMREEMLILENMSCQHCFIHWVDMWNNVSDCVVFAITNWWTANWWTTSCRTTTRNWNYRTRTTWIHRNSPFSVSISFIGYVSCLFIVLVTKPICKTNRPTLNF